MRKYYTCPGCGKIVKTRQQTLHQSSCGKMVITKNLLKQMKKEQRYV